MGSMFESVAKPAAVQAYDRAEIRCSARGRNRHDGTRGFGARVNGFAPTAIWK